MKKTIVAGLFALLGLVAAQSAQAAETGACAISAIRPARAAFPRPCNTVSAGWRRAAASALVTGAIATKVMIAIGRSAPRGVPGRSAGTGSGVSDRPAGSPRGTG